MELDFLSSSFGVTDKDKQWIKDSLKKFKKNPLSQVSTEQLRRSEQLYKTVKASHSQVFIFAFGGIGASFRICQSFFFAKNKKTILVDSLHSDCKNLFSKMTKTEMSKAHFVFISKSGQTAEILFYKNLIQKLYSKNKISLKNKVTILTQNLKSPLLSWGERLSTSIVFLEDSLPGRFAFFNLSGLFQFQAFGLKISPKLSKPVFAPSHLLEFFVSQFKKREFFLCSFQPELNLISSWLELSWSESLFKENMKRQAPILRAISYSDLQHGFIEELVAKQSQICFWALNLKSFSNRNHQMKSLLESKKIPYLIINVEKKFLSLFELIMAFYQILFLAGELSGVDIRTQPWVDYLKSKDYNDFI